MNRRWERQLLDLLDDVGGGTVEQTNGNHVRIQLKNGAVVFAASTPSDRRNLANIRAQIRRAAQRRA